MKSNRLDSKMNERFLVTPAYRSPPQQPLPRLCNYHNPDESYDDEMWSLKTTLLNAGLCNLAWIIKPLSDFYGR